MESVRDKVVRVENVTPTVHFLEDGQIPGKESPAMDLRPASESPKPAETYDILGSTATGDIYDNAGDSVSEGDDVLPPLPSNWPQIPQIFIRRNWDFSTATSPGINKATSHLELLQNIIEDWYKETEADIISRASSRLSKSQPVSVASGPVTHSDTSHGGSRRQLHFTNSAASSQQQQQGVKAASRASRHTSATSLSIQGIGAVGDPALSQPPSRQASRVKTVEEPEYEIPYLGAEDVIDEVLALLARLENDRRETKEALEKEKQRVAMLGNRIDDLAHQRMSELPLAVQREHEACAMDINELNWHVSYRGRVEARIQNKVHVAEVLNTKLKDDIAFVNKHCPLVEEKLELESEAMSRIKVAQTETNDELGTTVERCAKVENKSEEAFSKAGAERTHIKKDLDSVRTDLQSISEDLAEAKMTFNTYIHQCNDYRQQLKDNEQELRVLQVRDENTKAAESLQATKVRELQAKIVEQEFEHRRLDDMNIYHQKQLDALQRENSNAANKMTLSIEKKVDELKGLTRSNQELAMDIDDAKDKIQECLKKKIADEKNLSRMDKEKQKTKDQIRATEEELGKIRIIHNAIRQKLLKEEEKCMQEEEGLKNTAESLRKQVKDEIHSRTVINSRIQSDSGELDKGSHEIKHKKEKVDKKVLEVDLAVKQILEKVEKLRAKHAEKVKIIEGLGKDLAEVKRLKKELIESIEKMRQELNPKHKQLTEDVLNSDKKLDHIDWKTEMMNKNMDDMEASKNMMSKSIVKTQKAIDILQDELDDLTVQINTAHHLQEELKMSLNQATSRISDMQKRHRDHMNDRHKVHKQHEIDYENNLKLNTELASRYRRLQNEYVAIKNQQLNKFDERISMEVAIKDVKQIQSLQKRLHTALSEYYKFRGLYNQSELHRMDSESIHNAQKVSVLQTEMDEALEDISSFMSNQMDGKTAHRMAMQKVLREEKEEKLKQQQQQQMRGAEAAMNMALTHNSRSATLVS